MEYVTKENLNIIKQSNEQMLSYFQSVYITKLESLQGLKTESFEIEVKIEELEKTKRLYAFKSNDSKSIFSPLSPNPASENEKSRVIDTQLHDLYGAKAVLAARIATLEQELSSIQEKLELLGKAATAIGTLSVEQVITDKDEDQTEDAFAYNAAEEDTTPHGYNVLML